jgi:hypothetical protein
MTPLYRRCFSFSLGEPVISDAESDAIIAYIASLG